MSRTKSAYAVGSVYTGEAIAAELARQVVAMEPRVAVFDPACGDGRLLEAVRALLPDIPLFGMDTDPAAVESCHAKGLSNVTQGDALFDDLPRADVWIMNPPYLGGLKIGATLGPAYLKKLQARYGKHGTADYCSYWLRRADDTSEVDAIVGVFTNTIAQGDTREAGVKHLVEAGWEIIWAETNRKWEGEKASVCVSLFAARLRYAYAPPPETGRSVVDAIYRASGIGETIDIPSADDVARLLTNCFDAGWSAARRLSPFRQPCCHGSIAAGR